jgi:hypothetical protein
LHRTSVPHKQVAPKKPPPSNFVKSGARRFLFSFSLFSVYFHLVLKNSPVSMHFAAATSAQPAAIAASQAIKKRSKSVKLLVIRALHAVLLTGAAAGWFGHSTRLARLLVL